MCIVNEYNRQQQASQCMNIDVRELRRVAIRRFLNPSGKSQPMAIIVRKRIIVEFWDIEEESQMKLCY